MLPQMVRRCGDNLHNRAIVFRTAQTRFVLLAAAASSLVAPPALNLDVLAG
jgi:hypothetical protein